MYPYKLQRTQALIEEDRGRRVKFADWIIENQNLLNDILWTDESYFCLDGCVNRHNCVIWGTTKPTQTFSSSMGSPKICIWMVISSTYVLTPFFFDATINGENYTNMLEDHVFSPVTSKKKITISNFSTGWCAATLFATCPYIFAIEVTQYSCNQSRTSN